ncbi:HAD family hydrolase [Chitinophaga vietnamensis]|uniref:HAD family hydrolase n=1 Tax=Chitinophaga vietnamensis TaxID=2593957 RepID=UPI0011775559|nr:HAD family phosphatase [Chitinophaga vietnamensis]
MQKSKITTLFLDIGGVLLTNGWDRNARKLAVQTFNLDAAETEERHHLTFDTYEEGKLTLDEYLGRVVFYEERNFSREDFREFMFRQSAPYPEMLEMVRILKAKYQLKIAIVNNEGRELNTHRIKQFGIGHLADFFISSCFVHLRKPDADIYRLALDIAQVKPGEVAYLEDRPMFVDVANSIGIHGIVHSSYATTVAALANLGLIL